MIEEAGGAEKLLLREVPTPEPVSASVLIRVRALGLNRSEWITRRGDSPSVRFPRVLGIECVGEVVAAPGTDLVAGQRVAALMGGTYSGGSGDITTEELSRYAKTVEQGALMLTLGPTFRFEQLVDAHRAMDANSANGKIVAVV